VTSPRPAGGGDPAAAAVLRAEALEIFRRYGTRELHELAS